MAEKYVYLRRGYPDPQKDVNWRKLRILEETKDQIVCRHERGGRYRFHKETPQPWCRSVEECLGFEWEYSIKSCARLENLLNTARERQTAVCLPEYRSKLEAL